MTPTSTKSWQDDVRDLAKAAGRLVCIESDDYACWRAPPEYTGQGATIGDECMRYAVEEGIVIVTARDGEGAAIEVQVP